MPNIHSNLHALDLKSLSELLATRKISSVELTRYFLNRIEQYNPELNAFITVSGQQALAQAKLADQTIAKNPDIHKTHPLYGIPIAHKDIFCTENLKTSCGSKMLDSFIAPYNATLVEKLNQSGTILLGKTNMDEFAMGSSNETSFYGAVKNPWNLKCVPGGSSGGTAAAVSARLVPAATGTDTGGSIRQPAAFCGITGIKPTYGRVSRYGMIAFASSLDQAGPMAPSALDCAYLLQAMAGWDPKDATSSPESVPNYIQDLKKPFDTQKSIKIGLPKEFFNSDLSSELLNNLKQAQLDLKSAFPDQKLEFHNISLPNINLSIPTYYVIAPAECSSNLARYDGIRFGHRCENPRNLEDLYCRTRSEGFGTEVKRRILTGTYVLSAGFYDAYYKQAQKIRRLISQDFQNAFKIVDFIFGPTTPTPAFELGANRQDPVTLYLADVYTAAVNLAGLPAMSLPSGLIDQKPVGIQLIGNFFTESKLLQLGHAYQQVTHWHEAIPELFV